MIENLKIKREFIINDYLTLKLIKNKTFIYVAGKKFRKCATLLLNIPVEEIKSLNEIDSIDEASEKLTRSLDNRKNLNISPETIFWGHCSNLHVWYENDYDTRLLHRNLAFSLLKKLTEVGDSRALKVFQEEIAKRIMSGNQTVMKYLIIENYLSYLSKINLKTLFSTILEELKSEIKKFLSDEFLDSFKSSYKRKKEKDVIRDQIYNVLETICDTEELKSYKYVACNDKRFFIEGSSLKITGINKISEIQGLESLLELKELDLSGNRISKIEKLDHLSKLVKLDLGSNMISKIENLDNLKMLKELNLGVNYISRIENLDLLIELEDLYLCSNNISSIEGLNSLSLLNRLDLSVNEISKIVNIENLTHLEFLYLDGNSISKIEGLDNLRELIVLDLQSNRIKEIDNLKNLKKLHTLKLGENLITEIQGLEPLENLKRLDLSRNPIKEVKNLKSLSDSLKYLNLENKFLKEPFDYELHDWEVYDALDKLES